jgi:hypothetical protein
MTYLFFGNFSFVSESALYRPEVKIYYCLKILFRQKTFYNQNLNFFQRMFYIFTIHAVKFTLLVCLASVPLFTLSTLEIKLGLKILQVHYLQHFGLKIYQQAGLSLSEGSRNCLLGPGKT